jgi:MOSC domain-containing protein YiiM
MIKTLSLDEMESGLAQAGPSPQDEGRLELIVRRPRLDEREVLEQAELTQAQGLAGDYWLSRDGERPDRQVTLMNSRVIGLLAQEPARWPLAGDQLYVDLDLSEDNLPAGQQITIGGAVLEISAAPHTGCAKFTSRFGSDATRFVNSPQGRRERRRGVNARVVQAGVVRQGDTVKKVDPGGLS